MKAGAFVPPGDLRVEVGAGEVFLAGHAHFRWRAGEGVDEQDVEAGAEFGVEARFHLRPRDVVPMRADRGESLGTDEALAIGVRGGRRLLHEEPVVGIGAMRRWRPELGHHQLAAPVVFQSIERAGVRAGAFRVGEHAVLRGAFC